MSGHQVGWWLFAIGGILLVGSLCGYAFADVHDQQGSWVCVGEQVEERTYDPGPPEEYGPWEVTEQVCKLKPDTICIPGYEPEDCSCNDTEALGNRPCWVPPYGGAMLPAYTCQCYCMKIEDDELIEQYTVTPSTACKSLHFYEGANKVALDCAGTACANACDLEEWGIPTNTQRKKRCKCW